MRKKAIMKTDGSKIEEIYISVYVKVTYTSHLHYYDTAIITSEQEGRAPVSFEALLVFPCFGSVT